MRILAKAAITAVVWFHVLVVIAVVAGGWMSFTGQMTGRPALFGGYIILISTVSYAFAWSKACVLTDLENNLRRRFLPGTEYHGGCISHYLEQLLGVRVGDKTMLDIVTGTIVIGIVGIALHRQV